MWVLNLRICPCDVAQNAVSVNEFLGDTWDKKPVEIEKSIKTSFFFHFDFF